MPPLLYACILLLPLAADLFEFDCIMDSTSLLLSDIGELAEIETSTEETYVQLL